MLYVYVGTDSEKTRAKMQEAVAAHAADVLRVTDAHVIEDLRAALRGGGMFSTKRVVVFEGLSGNTEMLGLVLDTLPYLKESSEPYYILEEKPAADVRKKIEKYAERIEKFDAPKKERDSTIFAAANALKRGDKKNLWVSYVREIYKGSAPEAIHGVLFWAAKDMLVKSGGNDSRARMLVAELAEMPHVARRRGEDLEYALERFALSGA